MEWDYEGENAVRNQQKKKKKRKDEKRILWKINPLATISDGKIPKFLQLLLLIIAEQWIVWWYSAVSHFSLL